MHLPRIECFDPELKHRADWVERFGAPMVISILVVVVEMVNKNRKKLTVLRLRKVQEMNTEAGHGSDRRH